MNFPFNIILFCSVYILIGYITAVLLMVLKVTETHGHINKRDVLMVENRDDFRLVVFIYPAMIPNLLFKLIGKILSKIPIPFYKSLPK